MEEVLSLRAREKRQRHALIAETALDLFATRGFDATTVHDIAEAAGIAPRTFFLHFPSKDDVVFAFDQDRCAQLAHGLAARREGTDVLTAAADVLSEWLTQQGGHKELVRERLISQSPTLTARARAQSARYQRIISEAIRANLQAGPADPRPVMIAAAALAGWEAIGQRHAAGLLPAGDIPAQVEQVSELAAATLETLARYRPR